MTALDLMRSDASYVARFSDMPNDLQTRAKRLCARYNRTEPDAAEERVAILADLLGTSGPQVFIEPNLRCDYGFNVHFHGLAIVNYDCCFLDTSPIHIGAGAFIAPGCVLACAGHAVDPAQRAAGIQTSAPITLGENVWLGANVTVCGGVTIGDGSVIGAGSVVTRDVPAGVVAAGVPCRLLRPIDERDRVEPYDLTSEPSN